jgi:cobalt-zinc-cadmium efflux system outer membrane protein
MRSHLLLCAALLPLATGCSLGGHVPADYPNVARDIEAPAPKSPAPTLADDESIIAKEARLEAITRVAVAKNPGVLEARDRARAALARVKAVGRLPDPELKYELWGQPLNRPWALNETNMHMFGFRQSFPAGGMLDAQSRIALEEARVALELTRARVLDVVADVRKAWASYWAADREKALHVEHAELTDRIVELSKVQLTMGKTSQADVLRMSLEATRVHTDLISLQNQRTISLARLNALMGRAIDAPIGPPPEPKLADAAPKIADVRASVLARRPELAAAGAAVKKGEAAVDGAKSEARVPMFMVGIDYQLMPMAPMPHNFGAMVQMSLPWLNPRHGDEIRAAEAALSADKSAQKSLETTILLEVQEAIAKYEAARTTFQLLDTQLLPASRKAFESAQATYAAGGGGALAVVEALRMYLQVRIDLSRARANVEIAISDVERAIGGPLSPVKGKS